MSTFALFFFLSTELAQEIKIAFLQRSCKPCFSNKALAKLFSLHVHMSYFLRVLQFSKPVTFNISFWRIVCNFLKWPLFAKRNENLTIHREIINIFYDRWSYPYFFKLLLCIYFIIYNLLFYRFFNPTL